MRAYESLAEFNLPVSGCVINRMTPDLDNDFIQTRRSNERLNVEQLRDELPDLHLHEVELKDTDIHGLDLLRSISLNCMERFPFQKDWGLLMLVLA